MPYEFDWIDAFTETPFGGNGCVVVHGADALAEADRMALVRETSLSECAFLVASDKADFGARYYLADRPILMAGHPTIATVASLLSRGMVDLGAGEAAFSLELGAGVFPIHVRAEQGRAPLITMTQAAPTFGAAPEAEEVAAIYGLSAHDIAHAPRMVSTGTEFCVTVLTGHDALRRAVLNPERLEAFRARYDNALMEPFLVTLSGVAGGDTFSRLLLEPPKPAEDPFTGAATGCMAAYLWEHGLIDTPRFIAEQGHWMGRPGAAEVEVLGPPGAITGVNVAGRGVVVMSGGLHI